MHISVAFSTTKCCKAIIDAHSMLRIPATLPETLNVRPLLSRTTKETSIMDDFCH